LAVVEVDLQTDKKVEQVDHLLLWVIRHQAVAVVDVKALSLEMESQEDLAVVAEAS
jgi:hypothetical protein